MHGANSHCISLAIGSPACHPGLGFISQASTAARLKLPGFMSKARFITASGVTGNLVGSGYQLPYRRGIQMDCRTYMIIGSVRCILILPGLYNFII